MTNQRDLLVEALKDLASNLARNPKKDAEIAYYIAGLLATDYARTLKPGDPIDEILTIAGELEINPDNAIELRSELVQKINSLQ